ncbi:MAG: 50S ribosomal protein L24 [Legionellales bacterium]|jgi:large subunit ribosomal protein L24
MTILKFKIKTGDEVILIAGKDKGRRGKVVAIDKQAQRVRVEGLNLMKKHVRPNPQQGQQGGVVEKEAFIHISNVAIFNPLTQKADRVGYRHLEDGTKVRVFKSDNERIEV